MNLISMFKRASLALFLFLVSCTHQYREWQLEEDVRCCEGYASSKMYLRPNIAFNGLEVELVSTENTSWMYLNFRCIPLSTKEAQVSYTIENATYNIQAPCLAGGQRVLMPEHDAEAIIAALMDDKPVQIVVGRYSSEITPKEFGRHYKKMQHGPHISSL